MTADVPCSHDKSSHLACRKITMNWTTLEFEQLTVRELYLIMRARSAVFVVEQSRVHLDADGHDEAALHLFAFEDMKRPMPVLAYARIRPGEAEHQEVVIDKVLTSPSRRGDGTADALLERVLRAVDTRWPGHLVRVYAPLGLLAFYERFGFCRTEGPYLECGAAVIGLARDTRRGKLGVIGWRRADGGDRTVQTVDL
jgi:ElaA protein